MSDLVEIPYDDRRLIDDPKARPGGNLWLMYGEGAPETSPLFYPISWEPERTLSYAKVQVGPYQIELSRQKGTVLVRSGNLSIPIPSQHASKFWAEKIFQKAVDESESPLFGTFLSSPSAITKVAEVVALFGRV